MAKVKLTITESRCRCGLHRAGETFEVGDLCPPICHELWHCAYPLVYALQNGAELDHGDSRAPVFETKCPDGGRVVLRGERLRERPAVEIVEYLPQYRDDMIFMVLEAKNALGRVPRLNEDLLDVPANYLAKDQGFWLAVEAGRVTGCIGTRTDENGAAWLSRLYVKAGRKRQGIGTRLLETAEDFLRGQGVKTVHVHLGADYFESHRFYPKHGYREYAPLYMSKDLEGEQAWR